MQTGLLRGAVLAVTSLLQGLSKALQHQMTTNTATTSSSAAQMSSTGAGSSTTPAAGPTISSAAPQQQCLQGAAGSTRRTTEPARGTVRTTGPSIHHSEHDSATVPNSNNNINIASMHDFPLPPLPPPANNTTQTRPTHMQRAF